MPFKLDHNDPNEACEVVPIKWEQPAGRLVVSALQRDSSLAFAIKRLMPIDMRPIRSIKSLVTTKLRDQKPV